MLSPTQLDQGLAPALRALRKRRGHSQEALAHAAGITTSAMSKIERQTASPMWSTLTRILGVLEVSLAELEAEIEGLPLASSVSVRSRHQDDCGV